MTDILSVIGAQAEAAVQARREGRELESPAIATRFDATGETRAVEKPVLVNPEGAQK